MFLFVKKIGILTCISQHLTVITEQGQPYCTVAMKFWLNTFSHLISCSMAFFFAFGNSHNINTCQDVWDGGEETVHLSHTAVWMNPLTTTLVSFLGKTMLHKVLAVY